MGGERSLSRGDPGGGEILREVCKRTFREDARTARSRVLGRGRQDGARSTARNVSKACSHAGLVFSNGNGLAGDGDRLLLALARDTGREEL